MEGYSATRAWRDSHIGAQVAQMRADFDRFGPVRHRCRCRDFDVGVIVVTRLRLFVYEYERSKRYRENSAPDLDRQ